MLTLRLLVLAIAALYCASCDRAPDVPKGVTVSPHFKSNSTSAGEIVAELTDIENLPDGRVAVLDGRSSEILILSRRLRPLWRFPNHGPNADRLNRPGLIAALGQDRLLVYEQGIRRITTVRLGSDAASVVGRFQVDHDVQGMCTLHDAIYVRGLKDGEVVQVYDTLGHRYRHFGDPPVPPVNHPLVSYYLDKGPVLCDPVQNPIITAASAFPLVTSYDTAGVLVDEDTIPEFNMIRFKTSSRGLTVWVPEGEKADAIIGIGLADESRSLVVQTRRTTGVAAGTPPVQYRSMIDKHRDGRFIPLRAQPQTMYELRNGMALPLGRNAHLPLTPIQLTTR